MKTFFALLLSCFIFTSLHAGNNSANFIAHHTVIAKRGDAVIKLLNKYDLIAHQCNVGAFYRINKMSKNDVLYAGKKYVLPIAIYEYNKTSIRSTIGKNDWDLAKKIAAYNRVLRDRNLKRSYYMDDNRLYVPFHLVNCEGMEHDKNTTQATAAAKEEPVATEKIPTIEATPVKTEAATIHFATTAVRGDGIFHLLNRYDLYNETCNRNAFYTLNNLSKNSGLHASKSYTLPIRIYSYNRESIRSTIGNDDWDVARKIAAYNKMLVDKGLKKAYYMDDAILYVPYHFIDCPEATPGAVKTETVAAKVVDDKKEYLINNLYGEHKKFEKVSDKLKDEAYYIVSGHGGPDPGAMCKHGSSALCEDEYAYDVSLRLARNLEANGAKVFIIIQDKNDGIREFTSLKLDYDEVCIDGSAIPRKQLHRLRQRVDAVNTNYRKNKNKYSKHKVISIHIDSRPTHKRQDVFFYHAPGSKAGKKLAHNVQNTFREKYKIHRKNGEYHGTVTERGLYVLRHTDPVAVYVELANIKNHLDQKRIVAPSQRQALADWLYLGLTK